MKNKIIMLFSAALLLTTLSVYAQENANTAKEQIKQLDSTVFTQALEQVKTQEQAAGSESDIRRICKQDTYCQDYIKLLQEAQIPWEKTVKNTKNITDYKTALYQKKYEMVNNSKTDEDKETVYKFEIYKLLDTKNLDFNSNMAILTNIPLRQRSILFFLMEQISVLELNVREMEELNEFIKTFSDAPVCSLDLDVNKYNLKNFCLIDKELDVNPKAIVLMMANGSVKNKDSKIKDNKFNSKFIKKQKTQQQEEEISEEGVIASL